MSEDGDEGGKLNVVYPKVDGLQLPPFNRKRNI